MESSQIVGASALPAECYRSLARMYDQLEQLVLVGHELRTLAGTPDASQTLANLQLIRETRVRMGVPGG